MVRRRNPLLPSACLAAAAALAAPSAQAKITIAFDFSLDAQANNFFNNNTNNGQNARATLTRAAQYYQDRILESNLPAINPPFVGSWSANFRNPATGSGVSIADLSIPANTIKVYVAGRSALADGAIAEGGFGGYTVNASASSQFRNDVGRRGQAGMEVTPPATDFGTWGGAIAFNRDVTWNFGAANPTPSQQDFFTIALHEIGHVLGVGIAPSFRTNQTATAVPGGRTQYVGPFFGPKSKAAYGGQNIPLEAVPAVDSSVDPVYNASHFAEGVMSTLDGVVQQETIFDPTIAVGARKKLTLLDWAVLDDTGWDLAKPGDATADGAVDFDDLLALAQNYGIADGARRWSQGDFTYDGNVNFDDLLKLAQNYNTNGMLGEPVAAGTADFNADWQTAMAMTGVPEPATLGTLALAVAAGLTHRRKR